MAWTSLSTRLSNLPLVLSGPIVRETKASSVSVWIALRTAQTNLRLIIKDSAMATLGSAATATKAFGQNLHVVVITVTGLALNADTIYFYDLQFDDNKTLASDDILSVGAGGISKITYGNFSLPSFLLPASQVQNLKIAHGSCRKIHGGQRVSYSPQTPGYFLKMDTDNLDVDALSNLDALIEANFNIPSRRPQQLFLTGDQIYADDVADLVLFMIQDAATTLVGIDDNFIESRTGPLARYSVINTSARMTSDEYGKSHLISLAEFYTMYLLVWSDTLWSELPTSQEFESYVPTQSRGSENFLLFNLSNGDYEEYCSNELLALENFRSYLPAVRKALANIPTYMMFDDHEITDDWFISGEWCQNVLGNTLARNIIQNGLSAFAVFQAWGNTPERFATAGTPEFRTLAALTTIKAELGGVQSTWNEVGTAVLPAIGQSSDAGETHRLTGGPDWYFRYDGGYYQVIVLNTRTRRGFNSRSHARLLSTASMDNQINQGSTDAAYKFTIVVAPAPVIGHTVIEGIQKISKGGGALAKVAEYDFEPWTADAATFSRFLQKCTRFRKVIFLSGDVHYAFSARVDYRLGLNGGQSPGTSSVFLQFTASSLKNSEKKTTDHVYGQFPFLGGPAMSGGKGWDLAVDVGDFDMVGWDTDGQKGFMESANGVEGMSPTPIPMNMLSSIDYEPFVSHADLEITITTPPDRSYHITFLEDSRDADQRGAVVYGAPAAGRYCAPATMHRSTASFDQAALAIGNNNIGLLNFSLNGTAIKVSHQFWYRPRGYELGAWTVHESTF